MQLVNAVLDLVVFAFDFGKGTLNSFLETSYDSAQ